MRVKNLVFIIIAFSFIINLKANDVITPIPLEIKYNSSKAKLGKKLFFDTRLSKNNTISCASCHILEVGGDDNLQFSFGIEGKKGHINSPTVLNAVFNFRQFWNGRAKDLKEQALVPIQNPIEMGHDLNIIVSSFKKDAFYNKKFNSIYKDGVTKDNIADALAEFQKTLITPNAPFDKFLRGDRNALSKQQKRGYELFKSKGCITCHNGINIGGNLYSRMGIVEELKLENKGLYDVTKDEQDLYLFKVPSLRNVEHTAPYAHHGKLKTLEETVNVIAKIQLGTELTKKEIDDLVSFLKSLSGELKVIDD